MFLNGFCTLFGAKTKPFRLEIGLMPLEIIKFWTWQVWVKSQPCAQHVLRQPCCNAWPLLNNNKVLKTLISDLISVDVFGILDWYNVFLEIIFVLIYYWSLKVGESQPLWSWTHGVQGWSHLWKVEVIWVMLYYLLYILILCKWE